MGTFPRRRTDEAYSERLGRPLGNGLDALGGRETDPKPPSFTQRVARPQVARSFERMYAIFEDGSHQFRVKEGDKIVVDRRDGEPGSELVFSKVLLVTGDGEPRIGIPLVEGARVVARIVDQFRAKKIIIQKFRRRKNMRRRKGHRQPHTMVQITGVNV
jgi:large subunit ribosomal protein L21